MGFLNKLFGDLDGPAFITWKLELSKEELLALAGKDTPQKEMINQRIKELPNKIINNPKLINGEYKLLE